MSLDSNPAKVRKGKSKLTSFWRALRFLAPYRGLVVISVICAILLLWAWGKWGGAMIH